MVEEDFRARSAGARIAHRPEIRRGRDADDFRFGKARDLLPKTERFVIVDIDCRGQALLGKPQILRQQFPGERDGIRLEVIAEREIAQHLEKGEMARGIAHIVEIVVLAAGAHAFLRGRRAHIGPLFLTREDVLELHHAGVREEQRGVVARHERRGGDHLMALGLEVIEERRTDVGQAFHRRL